jgi:nitrogen-specific signal transduction histidine kinase
VRRTTTLVASLLTFAQQAPARLAAVDVNSVLQTAVRLLGPQLEAQNTPIRLDLAPSLPPVLADANQILHVCIHLAGQINAHLNRESQTTLWLRTVSEGNRVVIDFLSCDADSSEWQAQPVSMKWISESEVATKSTSLSLSACRRIVEEHGGQLMQSSNACSTAFSLELRVATSATNPSAFVVANRAAAH